MTDFKIETYDKGGYGAIPNDAKLTGDEVKKAMKDGWNVWDGYSANDSVPANTKEQKQEAKKEYVNVDRFDKGGKNAIAGDGKLTGDEVKRANMAGFSHVYEGDTAEEFEKYPVRGLREEGHLFGSISRAAANKTPNKFVNGLAIAADVILSPITLPMSIIIGVIKD